MSPALRQGAAGEGRRARRGEGHDHLYRGRRQRGDRPGHRRPLQAAMEAGFRHALGGARRRLRDVRQGPSAVGQTLYDAICSIAGGEPPEHFMLRAVPRREGPEDLQVEGQRPHRRRMADLWAARRASRSSCSRSRAPPSGSISTSSPRRSTITSRCSRAITPTRRARPQRLENPVWHIHDGNPPAERYPVSFALLLTLVSASNAHNRDRAVGLHPRLCAAGASPEANPGLDRLVGYALRYYEDFVKPTKKYRAPTDKERAALADLADVLEKFGDERDAEKVQNEVYEIGKRTSSSRCATGSRRSTKCCSARPRARASAPSRRCSAARRPRR